MNCIKCGKEHIDYPFRVLHVETLHVRDIKEKRVQTLGDFEDYGVCADCAREKLQGHQISREELVKTCIPYLVMMAAGVVIAALFASELPILLFGVGMAVCGITCLYGNIRNRTAKKREMEAVSEAEALQRCAWECMIDGAPKKNDINDISYIPVNEQTLARKNGDLMILYDLLPEIAVEAHKRIHADAE